MSQENTTPAAVIEAGPAGAESAEQDGGRTLENTDDIVAALEAAEQTPQAAQEDEAGQSGEDAEEAQETSPHEEGEADDSAVDDGRPEKISAPATWSTEEKALFAKLPAEIQSAVMRRETERERYANAKMQEAAQAKSDRETSLMAMQQAVTAARVAVEADFAGIDWLTLQKENPGLYLQLDAQRRERFQSVEQALGVQLGIVRQEQARQTEEMQRHLSGEMQTVLPRIQTLIGDGFVPATFKTDVSAYLKGLGAPDEHINGISHGYQLEIATKAMLYDRQESARVAATRKVANAPKVQGAKARPQDSGQNTDAKKWRNALKNNPDSTDALTNLILAEG